MAAASIETDIVHRTAPVGVRFARLGTSSVRYEIGPFANDDDAVVAQGHFVHVYVDRATNKPLPIPHALRRRSFQRCLIPTFASEHVAT
jgi:acyl-CoA thioesterase FadM